MIDLRCGDWRDVLADVEMVDAVISDTPYGERTHAGHDAGADIGDMRDLCYSSFSEKDVSEFVRLWAPRCNGWMAIMSCSDLAHVWRREMATAGRYAFAPVACVNKTPPPRMTGDGPTSATIYMNVSRPKHEPYSKWGSLPGQYGFRRERGTHIGGKPFDLMCAVIRDYTRAGDLVCDPCAGMATTAVAAESLGREFVGSEIDPDTYAKARVRLDSGTQIDLFGGAA